MAEDTGVSLDTTVRVEDEFDGSCLGITLESSNLAAAMDSDCFSVTLESSSECPLFETSLIYNCSSSTGCSSSSPLYTHMLTSTPAKESQSITYNISVHVCL